MFQSLVRVTIDYDRPCERGKGVKRDTFDDPILDSASIKENKIHVAIGRALAASERKVKVLEFDAWKVSISMCQLYEFCEALGEKSRSVLGDLECLRISEVYDDDEGDDGISKKYWNSLNFLTRFTPLLTELVFSTSFKCRGRFTPTMDLPFPKLCYLRTIDLVNVEFYQSFFLRMLQAYSGTIRRLRLRFILITDGTWAPIFDQLRSRLSLELLEFVENEEQNQDLSDTIVWLISEIRDVRDYYLDRTDAPNLLEFLNGQSTVNPLRKALEEAKAREREENGSESD